MRIRPYFLALLLLFFIWTSCGDVSETQNVPLETTQDSSKYGALPFPFVSLSKNASDAVVNWVAYRDFEQQATSLHQLSLEEIKEKTNKILIHSDSLESKIPDTLNTKAINSRLSIVKTRANILKLEANKGTVVSEKIETNIDEVNKAVNNLIIQINEKFQKDGIDLERIENEKKELEKQKKFLDSVYQAELKDQKK